MAINIKENLILWAVISLWLLVAIIAYRLDYQLGRIAEVLSNTSLTIEYEDQD